MKRKEKHTILALMLGIVILASSCGAKAGSTAVAPGGPTPAPWTSPNESKQSDGVAPSYPNTKPEYQDTAAGIGSGGSRVYIDDNAKLIRQVTLSLQSTEFSAALSALDQLTERVGGYYEKAQTQSGDYFNANARRYASYTVRVPKERCDEFLSAVSDVGYVVNSYETTTDIGEQYYDAELRLKTLKTKQERLLALLEKAEKLEDIITLEGYLSQVQYEIEQYTSTLQRYDSLVDFATIEVSIQEVVRISDEPGETASLLTRLGNAFRRGFADFADRLGDAVIWMAYHTVGIVLLAAAVVIVLLGWRKVRNRRSKMTPPPQE